jgi:ABC-type transport system involved in multi-copper enzyme maturation permease subunit
MRLLANIGTSILFILAAIAVVFGFLFVLGSFSPQGSTSWILPGILIIGFGMVCAAGAVALIFFNRKKAKEEAAEINQRVNFNIDLPGEVKIESMKCASCGSPLTTDNI